MSEMFDDLKKLAEMLDKGEITQTEYDKIKADLLAEQATPAEPSHPMSEKSAGWYNDPSGKAQNQAYWDGTTWTGQTRSSYSDEAMGVGTDAAKRIGTEAAEVDEKKPIYKKTWFWLIVLVGVLMVMLNFTDGSSGGGNTPAADKGSQVGAYVVCQQFVEDRLKSPSSAEFGGPYSQVTSTLSTGRYKVDTYVDAQNSFGAMIRTDFVCTVDHKSGDTYSLVSLVMDE